MDTGEAAIDFLPRRSHKLLATPITPRLSPRSVVPVCRFAWAPRASARFSFYRSARSISSSRLALVSFLSLSRLVLSQFMAAKGATMGGGGVRSFFFSCAVFLSSLSFASSLGSPRRGVGSFPFPTVAASAWVPHHLIRSVHLIRPHCPIISSHHGTEALVSVVFQASNDGMAVSSDHHLIPSSSWSVSPVISSHASRRASRPHIPGHQRGRDEGRSKQTNTQERGGTGTRNRGARRGEEQKRERQYNGDGTRTEQERQASKDNEDMRRNHEQEQDAPHPFSPDPLAAGSRRFAGLILSPAPGAWDERTAIS